jgi:hypothetical protein
MDLDGVGRPPANRAGMKSAFPPPGTSFFSTSARRASPEPQAPPPSLATAAKSSSVTLNSHPFGSAPALTSTTTATAAPIVPRTITTSVVAGNEIPVTAPLDVLYRGGGPLDHNDILSFIANARPGQPVVVDWRDDDPSSNCYRPDNSQWIRWQGVATDIIFAADNGDERAVGINYIRLFSPGIDEVCIKFKLPLHETETPIVMFPLPYPDIQYNRVALGPVIDGGAALPNGTCHIRGNRTLGEITQPIVVQSHSPQNSPQEQTAIAAQLLGVGNVASAASAARSSLLHQVHVPSVPVAAVAASRVNPVSQYGPYLPASAMPTSPANMPQPVSQPAFRAYQISTWHPYLVDDLAVLTILNTVRTQFGIPANPPQFTQEKLASLESWMKGAMTLEEVPAAFLEVGQRILQSLQIDHLQNTDRSRVRANVLALDDPADLVNVLGVRFAQRQRTNGPNNNKPGGKNHGGQRLRCQLCQAWGHAASTCRRASASGNAGSGSSSGGHHPNGSGGRPASTGQH